MRIGILVVAYNAARTLAQVLDRIPAAIRPAVHEVLVQDDASPDTTHRVALDYQSAGSDLPLTVIRHSRNLGYGGNQKAGYRYAIDHGWDIAVLLHADGQYAPEVIADLVAPIESGDADAVLGSRMLLPGAARAGGMPLYKYAGNRILSRLENRLAGVRLSEWHSGYRAYSVATLRGLPFERNADGFHFDTQIILQLIEAGRRIAEVPIPTYYGDEISHVNGLAYAKDVVSDVLTYRMHKQGFGSGDMAFASQAYELKAGDSSSHARITRWLAERPGRRVLDLGCSDGAVAEVLRAQGHEVTGIDRAELAGVRDRVDRFVLADLDEGLPASIGTGYDVVVAADVLEHVRDPARVLREARGALAPGGAVVACIPNFGHWYPRGRTALGVFDYDRRGILDNDHVRFFTRRSFERLAARAGYAVRRREDVGLPLEVFDRGGASDRAGHDKRGHGRSANFLRRAGDLGVAVRPTLFAYQFLYELSPAPAADS